MVQREGGKVKEGKMLVVVNNRAEDSQLFVHTTRKTGRPW